MQRTQSYTHSWTRTAAPLLGLATLFALGLAAAPAHAQTSTPVYGGDAIDAGRITPYLRLGGTPYAGSTTPPGSTYIQLGQTGLSQDATIYGTAYDPNAVDVSQGFVARVQLQPYEANGFSFVVKNHGTSADYAPDNYYGSLHLPNSLAVVVGRKTPLTGGTIPNTAQFDVDIWASSATGTLTHPASSTLQFPQGVTLSNYDQVIQIQYLPRFKTLSVYYDQTSGGTRQTKLLLRVANVDLKTLGVTQPDSTGTAALADMGITANTARYGNNGHTPSPPVLEHLSIGNNLVFASGFGPNLYEDRFPFLTTGQSVWSPNSDSAQFTANLEKKGSFDKQVSSPVGIKDIFTIQPGAFARNYDIGMRLDATATGGTANINYPLFLDMSFPAQFSVAPGQGFVLPITFYPDPAATLATTSPQANVTANLRFQGQFGFSLNATALGQSISSGNVVNISTNFNDKIFDLNEILGSGLIPNVNGGTNYAGYFQGKQGAGGSTTGGGTKGSGSTKGAGKGEGPAKFVSVGITYPLDLSTTGTVGGTLSNPRSPALSGSADEPFVTLSSDFTNAILGEIPGLDILTAIPFFNSDYSLNLGGTAVELGFHIADFYGSVDLGTHVDYNFTPQPQVWLALDDPYLTADPTKHVVIGPYPLDPTTGTVLNPPTINMPAGGDPLVVTPYVTLSSGAIPTDHASSVAISPTTTGSAFTTNGQLNIGGQLGFNPFEFSYQFGSSSFNSSTALGLPFPYTVSGSTPVVTVTKNFEVGKQTGGASNAVPFQKILKGKSFTLLPTGADSPLLDSVMPAATAPQPSGGTQHVALSVRNASIYGQVVWDYDGGLTASGGAQPGAPYTDYVLSDGSPFTNLSTIPISIPSALLTTPGLHTITLLNQDGPGAAQVYPSNAVSFTITAPAPTLTTLRATNTAGATFVPLANGPGFQVRVQGSSFLAAQPCANSAAGYAGSVVQWNGKPLATQYVDANDLIAVVPANLVTTTNAASVTVVTPGPGGGTSGTLTLTPQNPVPSLTSLSQTQSNPVQPGATASLTIDLYGANFSPQSLVLWTDSAGNGQHLIPTYDAPGHLGAALPSGDLGRPGAYTVQVQNPAPGGGTSAGLVFNVGQYPTVSTTSMTGGVIALTPKFTKGSDGYHLTFTVTDTSAGADATAVILTSATAQYGTRPSVSPATPNPLQAILVGTVPAGRSVTVPQKIQLKNGGGASLSDAADFPDYVFPLSLAQSGQAVLLTVNGSSNGQQFTAKLRATLP